MSDELGEDLLRWRRQVGGRFEVLVILTSDPELDVLLAELGLEELAKTLSADCSKYTYTHKTTSSQCHNHRKLSCRGETARRSLYHLT